MGDPDDQTLVQQALSGQAAAFGELARRYYPSLLAIADSLLLDHHLAEDAAQEALAAACRQLPRLKKPERFGPWIAAICRNVARDMLREFQRQKRLDFRLASDRDGAGEDDTAALLTLALHRLPPDLREVIFLRFYNDMTYRQMADVLGAGPKAIDGRIRRAKKKLAFYLKRAGFQR